MLDTIFDPTHTEQLYNDLRTANSEAAKKERFLTYVIKVFKNDDKVQDFVRGMALGAETAIATLPGTVGPRGVVPTARPTPSS